MSGEECLHDPHIARVRNRLRAEETGELRLRPVVRLSLVLEVLEFLEEDAYRLGDALLEEPVLELRAVVFRKLVVDQKVDNIGLIC